MKLDTKIVLAKGLCYVTIGFFLPLTTSLTQWANSGTWPDPIIWVVTAGSCMVGAATQLLSYLSGSYADYVKGRANGSGASGDTTQFLLSKMPTAPKTNT